MKTLHRRRIALGAVILLALMSFLLLLWKMGSRRQGVEVLAGESASLRFGQPPLEGAREPGARSKSESKRRNEPGPLDESDPWLQKDPKIRILVMSFVMDLSKGSSGRYPCFNEGVVAVMGIQGNWVAQDQVELNCEIISVPAPAGVSDFGDLVSGKNGLPNGKLPEAWRDILTYRTTQRGVENSEAHVEWTPAALDALSSDKTAKLWSMPRVLTRLGKEVTLEKSETIEGSMTGARVIARAERVAGGTALCGQAILRVLMAAPQDTRLQEPG